MCVMFPARGGYSVEEEETNFYLYNLCSITVI
jgi:hypothetical protein